MPADGNRYEIIDGELSVTTQPTWGHQLVGTLIAGALNDWGLRTAAGLANSAPGVILAEDTAVVPDVVWGRAARLPLVLTADGKLHGAPDVAIEILSPGEKNEQRDRETKLKAYSRFGVREYRIVDRRKRALSVYRREEAALTLAQTLQAGDRITSPLLPGFSAFAIATCLETA